MRYKLQGQLKAAGPYRSSAEAFFPTDTGVFLMIQLYIASCPSSAFQMRADVGLPGYGKQDPPVSKSTAGTLSSSCSVATTCDAIGTCVSCCGLPSTAASELVQLSSWGAAASEEFASSLDAAAAGAEGALSPLVILPCMLYWNTCDFALPAFVYHTSGSSAVAVAAILLKIQNPRSCEMCDTTLCVKNE